jgi:uroporphyrin-III C-methyltransferase
VAEENRASHGAGNLAARKWAIKSRDSILSDQNYKAKRSGKVFLVGAGPGDPELLTLRAARVLASADFVLHDALVSAKVLELASAHATLENVGKRCGERAMRQETIHARMITLALAGFGVVRLQGGDPVVFGRAGEEITALAHAGVDWEIVPGITAASAAAAAVGISLTNRRAAGQLIFVAGHRADDAMRVEIPAPPAGGATIAVYMPSKSYTELARGFLEIGWHAETPCIVISEVSAPRQRVVSSTIGSLGHCERLPAPTILIVGEAALVSDMNRDKFEIENASREQVVTHM